MVNRRKPTANATGANRWRFSFPIQDSVSTLVQAPERGRGVKFSDAEGHGVVVGCHDVLFRTITQRAIRDPSVVRMQMVSPIWKSRPCALQVHGGNSGGGPGVTKSGLAHAASPQESTPATRTIEPIRTCLPMRQG